VSHVVHLGDCLDPVTGLASLPDKSVDHVICCDPPYSEHVHSTRGTERRHDGLETVRVDFASLDGDVAERFCVEAARVARRWVLVFSCGENVALWKTWMTSAGLEWARFALWVKPNAIPQLTGDRPGQAFEAICVAHPKGKKRWNAGGKLGVWTISKMNEKSEHPTQKPTDLMEALVRDFTDPGETVLDPFAGSGTTGVACKRLGRSFIGWELDPKYHAIAVKRIASAREQMGLWAGGA